MSNQHQPLTNDQKCHALGSYAEQKSRGAYAAILYLVALNFFFLIALPQSPMLQDLCNMILTPLVMFLGSFVKAYVVVVVGELVGILILQNIAVSEKSKANFFNGH